MPVLSVRHLTRYRYRNPVAFGDHRMMLRPREGCDQRLLSSNLLIAPTPIQLRAIPVVIHSSLTGSANETHVKNVGADAYVAKFVAEDLANALRKALGKE